MHHPQHTEATPLALAIRSCTPALGATFVLSLFINAAMLVSPLYSMQIYDRVLTSRNVGTLLMLTLIVAMFLVLYGVLEYARAPACWSRAGVAVRGTLRRPLFDTMMRAELSPRHRMGQQVIRDAETISRLHLERHRPPRSATCRGRRCSWCCASSCIPLLGCRRAGRRLRAVLARAASPSGSPSAAASSANTLANEAAKFAACRAAQRRGGARRSAWATSCSTAGAARSRPSIAAMRWPTSAARPCTPSPSSPASPCRPALLCVGAWLAPSSADLGRRDDGRLDHHGPRARAGRADRRPVEAHRRLPRRLSPPRRAVQGAPAPPPRTPQLPTPKARSRSRTSWCGRRRGRPSVQGRQLQPRGRREPGDRRLLGAAASRAWRGRWPACGR